MALGLSQSATAVGVSGVASFLGTGGVEPYSYAVVAGGAGGTINSSTGRYTAPATISEDPARATDTIRVTDYANVTATATILVGTPLLLFCDVIQRELNLANGRVYLWDQKLMQPTDSGLYVAVSVLRCKPFANVNRATDTESAMVSMQATLDLDIISRGPAARDRKEEVIMALASVYSQQQQNGNGFYIAQLPTAGGFINLSNIDGAAIPYRFKISVNIQYAVSKAKAVDYFDNFATELETDPENPDGPIIIIEEE